MRSSGHQSASFNAEARRRPYYSLQTDPHALNRRFVIHHPPITRNSLKTHPIHPQTPVSAPTPMLSSSSSMPHPNTLDSSSLSPIQEQVALALASGATLTAAAEAHGIHRVTIYRWIKTIPDFTAAVQQARVEYILARRDDLHHLSNRAVETLLSILDDPHASPSTRLRAAMFILQRPHLPKAGWALPEPLPEPNRDTLVNSALIEKNCDLLAYLDGVPEEEIPAPPMQQDASPCNEMQPKTEFSEDVTEYPLGPPPPADPGVPSGSVPPRQDGLRSCPVPPGVQEARNQQNEYLKLLEDIESIERAMPRARSGKLPRAS